MRIAKEFGVNRRDRPRRDTENAVGYATNCWAVSRLTGWYIFIVKSILPWLHYVVCRCAARGWFRIPQRAVGVYVSGCPYSKRDLHLWRVVRMCVLYIQFKYEYFNAEYVLCWKYIWLDGVWECVSLFAVRYLKMFWDISVRVCVYRREKARIVHTHRATLSV